MAKVGQAKQSNKPAAAPVSAAPSAKPGTVDGKAPKVKKEKIKRIDHPALWEEVEGGDAKRLKLTEVPADFDPKLHKPLGRKDFATEEAFFLMKAAEFDKKAAEMRKAAEESKKIGGTKDKAKAKKLIKMQKAMAELMEQLKADGVDVDELLADDDAEESAS